MSFWLLSIWEHLKFLLPLYSFSVRIAIQLKENTFFFSLFSVLCHFVFVCFCFVLCSTHPQTQQTLANLSPSPSALWKIIWFPPLYTIIADPFSTFMVYPGYFMSFKNSLVKCFMATGRQKRQPCKLVSSLICVSSFIKDII